MEKNWGQKTFFKVDGKVSLEGTNHKQKFSHKQTNLSKKERKKCRGN